MLHEQAWAISGQVCKEEEQRLHMSKDRVRERLLNSPPWLQGKAFGHTWFYSDWPSQSPHDVAQHRSAGDQSDNQGNGQPAKHAVLGLLLLLFVPSLQGRIASRDSSLLLHKYGHNAVRGYAQSSLLGGGHDIVLKSRVSPQHINGCMFGFLQRLFRTHSAVDTKRP